MNRSFPLRAEQVWVHYGPRPVLQDITFTLPAGARLALLGPNGAGKTTLLRVLAGILSPTRGQVYFGDTPLRQLRRKIIAQRCAYLPQHLPTSCELTVQEVVALGRYPYLGPWGALRPCDWQAVEYALERLGLTSLRQRPLATLSGGERQRVFLARALAQEAPLLLLDEPIASLDIGRQLELMALLADLHAEGRTILAALHDPRLALEAFPTALLLHAGKLVAAGPTEQVLFAPEFAAAFGVRVCRALQVCFQPQGQNREESWREK